jgi:hypothetical protein
MVGLLDGILEGVSVGTNVASTAGGSNIVITLVPSVISPLLISAIIRAWAATKSNPSASKVISHR